MVPTTNFILKWIRSESGAHRYDENLSEVSLITKDAFEPSLPLSVVVHIFLPGEREYYDLESLWQATGKRRTA